MRTSAQNQFREDWQNCQQSNFRQNYPWICKPVLGVFSTDQNLVDCESCFMNFLKNCNTSFHQQGASLCAGRTQERRDGCILCCWLRRARNTIPSKFFTVLATMHWMLFISDLLRFRNSAKVSGRVALRKMSIAMLMLSIKRSPNGNNSITTNLTQILMVPRRLTFCLFTKCQGHQSYI